MKRVFWMIILMFGFCGMSIAQRNATAKVQNDHVAVGKPFTLDLTLTVPYGSTEGWNVFTADTLSAQIDILKRGDLQRTADADSNIVMQQQLTLMTFDTGYIQIPSLQLSTANRQLLTDPILLYSSTIAVDTTQPFRTIVEPIEQPESDEKESILLYLIIALVLVIVVVVGIVVWRSVKRRGGDKPVRRRVIPPYEKAIGDLESLKQLKLWQAGKVKEYHSNLTDIAREYIEGQFGVNAVEMSTDEILQEIKKLNFEQQTYDKINNVMELSDLVKFAKYSASELENDNAMNNVEGFVKESYNHYQAMKAKEEEDRRHV